MTSLFVSFTTLLGAIASGKVSQADLDEGLFFFGCVRSHAFNPGGAGEADEREWNRGKNRDGYDRLLAALQRAEEEGRAEWHRPDSKTRLDPAGTLNSLLNRRGFPSISLGDVAAHYCYPGVKQAIEDAGIPLQVLY